MRIILMAISLIVLICFATFLDVRGADNLHIDYRDALSKSIAFLQGQRSGKLIPSEQLNITWRGDSALTDGKGENVDLTGGYYDAGDNVKFNLPMAFTTTMLSWGAMEYPRKYGPVELKRTMEAIRWSADYLIKCADASKPGKFYVQVANPQKDHQCWERPEGMDTDRTVYSVSKGSDVAGETAAALAAASIVFRKVNGTYSRKLLETAKGVMKFAWEYRGSYSEELKDAVCPFYCSYSGYKDELLWGAAWLLRATNDDHTYLDYINQMGFGDNVNIFSWDNKLAGAQVLLSRRSLVDKDSRFDSYKQKAESFMCSILPEGGQQYTKGGLIYKDMGGSNLQYVTAITFLLTTYSKYLAVSKKTFQCGNNNLVITPKTLRHLARRQLDYILGKNPKNMSYMVGFGKSYPQHIHHRGASIPLFDEDHHKLKVGCNEGFSYMRSTKPNPNILTGAIVGGPDSSDNYEDNPDNYQQSEPTTYINAAIVGPLAYFAHNS